jgi:hypothetical protein
VAVVAAAAAVAVAVVRTRTPPQATGGEVREGWWWCDQLDGRCLLSSAVAAASRSSSSFAPCAFRYRPRQLHTPCLVSLNGSASQNTHTIHTHHTHHIHAPSLCCGVGSLRACSFFLYVRAGTHRPTCSSHPCSAWSRTAAAHRTAGSSSGRSAPAPPCMWTRWAPRWVRHDGCCCCCCCCCCFYF